MAKRSFLALFLIASLLVACGDAAPTAGAPTAFANACDKANDGQRIALEGYLMLPDSFSGDNSVVLWLYETDAFEGQPVGVQLSFGSGANQVSMVSDSYTDDDLEVHLGDGGAIGFGDRVTVSGKVYFQLVDQKFECSLENPLVAPAN